MKLIKKVKEVSDKALDKIHVPEAVKKAAKSELGRHLQKKIITELGESSRKVTDKLGVSAPVGKQVEDIARTTFEKLGIAELVKKCKQKTKAVRKRKGKGLYILND